MLKNTNIFDIEPEFRQYFIENWEYIKDVVLFFDKDENIIYFYAFKKDSIAMAKEFTKEEFSKFKKIYKYLSINYNFDILTNDDDSMKLIKHR